MSQTAGRHTTLVRVDASSAGLPDRPGVDLSKISIQATLSSDLLTPDLDRIVPYLWLVSTPRSSHILPLHRQLVRGRIIITCEAPALHLVWYHDRIFIKPLAAYLLSHSFWTFCITQDIFPGPSAGRDGLLPAAIGLIRTYTHLIKYPVDFKLAQKHDLLPENITYVEYSAFIKAFKNITDEEVAPRYTYGELRLSRLNLYTPILLFPRLTYHYMTPQWNSFFGNLIAPLLSAFAIFSIILSAMPVEIGVQGLSASQGEWTTFSEVSRWFSVVSLIFAATVIFVILFFVMFFIIHENSFALGILWAKRGGKKEKKEVNSSVV